CAVAGSYSVGVHNPVQDGTILAAWRMELERKFYAFHTILVNEVAEPDSVLVAVPQCNCYLCVHTKEVMVESHGNIYSTGAKFLSNAVQKHVGSLCHNANVNSLRNFVCSCELL